MNEYPNPIRFRPRQAGFTLVELVIVITIVAGLIVIGVPSMSEMIATQKVRGTADELFLDLTYARSEAIKRNGTVQVIRAGANWTEGWTVNTGGTVLRAQAGTKGVSASDANPTNVSFTGDGRVTGVAGTLNFSFSSGNALVSMRCVSVTPSGRPAVRIDRNRNGNCADG